MQLSRFPTALLSFAVFTGCLNAQERPKITGISHMAVYTSDPVAAEHFYKDELGAVKKPDPENPSGTIYRLSAKQFIEVLPLPAQHSIGRLDHVAFATEDVTALHSYLIAHHCQDVGAVTSGKDTSPWFFVRDPEGNCVQFVEQSQVASIGHPVWATAVAEERMRDMVSPRIIHVGFLVRDRAKEDAFYRDLLGFRPYWYGAMHPDKVDWVSLQVPDGHDWLEYMMTGTGSDTPDADKVDARQLGVLNHFSLGVPNMEAAVTKLYASDVLRYSPRHDGPQMGKDGKWQANLYDPDGTRVELMEFQPVMKPCCSAFTEQSPTE